MQYFYFINLHSDDEEDDDQSENCDNQDEYSVNAEESKSDDQRSQLDEPNGMSYFLSKLNNKIYAVFNPNPQIDQIFQL